MLYGFGDDEQPYAETVDLLEDLVIEYISETVSKTYLHYSLWGGNSHNDHHYYEKNL